MRLKGWEPERGWRAFATELVVVILGVLIALVAEQAISSLGRQQDVRSFRSAINDELADNLAAFQFRFSQHSCVASRLAELKTLRDRALNGQMAAVSGEIGRPATASMATSVWSARAPEVMNAMPLDLRLTYSRLYDELSANYELIAQEREAWRSMARLNNVPQLSPDDARILSELLFRAQTIDRSLRFNSQLVDEMAEQLGIRPSERMKQILGRPDGELCRPISS